MAVAIGSQAPCVANLAGERRRAASFPSRRTTRSMKLAQHMRLTRSVLWHFPSQPSIERCSLSEGAQLERLEGTVLTLLSGASAEIRYAITCDSSWKTRTCSVEIATPGSVRHIELEADDRSSWVLNRERVPQFDGIVDVDLGFSPCTNTLPIRRLGLDVGQASRISVVWLRFPALDLVRSEQVYARLSDRLYRYESGTGDFSAEIEVDALGIVTRYGDFWREVVPKG